MNPKKIYIEQQDEYLANLIKSTEYKVFVAMPFRNQFSYNSDQVFDDIIKKSIDKANSNISTSKKIGEPIRADKIEKNATEITDKIVEGIINSHFFIADFTMANHGVILEAGIALTLKNSKLLTFIIQGEIKDVHFDIKDNNFISYDKPDAIDNVATALIESVKFFESNLADQIKSVRQKLTPQAVYLIKLYGRLQKENPANSLHFGQIERLAKNGKATILGKNEDIQRLVYDSAVRELLSKKLVYLDYNVGKDDITSDAFGLHATSLGLAFIQNTWPNIFNVSS